jgi:serine/threonine-protein kinase
MAPEQLDYSEPASTRSDVFSLGIIFYELLTGRNPFRGESDFATIQAILKQEPPPLTGAGGPVPEALTRIVLKTLAKDPRARYQSAAEMHTALAGANVPPAPLEELKALLGDVLTPDTSQPEASVTGSTIRTPTKTGASRAMAVLFQLNWKVYAAVILAITVVAVLYLASSVRRPAAPPLPNTTAAPKPADAPPAAVLPPTETPPSSPADSNAGPPPPPPSAPVPQPARPAIAPPVQRPPKADSAAAKRKRALDLLNGKDPNDK